MGIDKMVEKTRQVLDKQRELNQLVVEMKDEVRAVHQENIALRKRIAELEHSGVESHRVAPEPERKPTPEAPRQEPIKPVVEASTKQVAPPVQVVEPKPQVQAMKQASSATPKSQPLLEFFLGKNVIVKIAAVLMVLAIITFGQIAYVDWLNDVGRFILILGLGLFSIGLGYFFEHKQTTVFSTIFYALGLVVLVADSFLGQYEYELYGNAVHMYYLLVVVAAPMVYFHNKRSLFLDTVLIPYYLFLMASPLVLFSDVAITVHTFILTFLLLGGTGFALYQHFLAYERREAPVVFLDLFVLLVAATFINLGAGAVVHSNDFSMGHVVVLLYQIGFVAFFLTYNFKRLVNRDIQIQVATLIVTGISFFVLGVSINGSFAEITNINNSSLNTMFAALLFLPIYIRLFLKRDPSIVNVTNLYLILTAVTTLFFTFFLSETVPTINGYTVQRAVTLSLKNMILVILTVVLFLSSTFTKDKVQKYVAYSYMVTMTLVYLFHFPGNPESFGFDGASIYVNSIIAALAMYLIHYVLGKNQEEDETKDVLTALIIVMAIPLFTSIAKDLFLDSAPVMITMVVLWLGGARYLTTLAPLRTKFETERTLGLNIFIALLILIANFFYLGLDDLIPADEAFSILFTFFFVLVGNVYLVQALREIYMRIIKIPSVNEETWFMGLFVGGVAIQAVFVTQYINFSFDKVILSSYYMIAASVAILWGFKENWMTVRKAGLFAIYFSLLKFFVYDFWANDFDRTVRFLSYFILALVLFGISALYSYLERTYGTQSEQE